jgi:hypothetical protein
MITVPASALAACVSENPFKPASEAWLEILSSASNPSYAKTLEHLRRRTGRFHTAEETRKAAVEKYADAAQKHAAAAVKESVAAGEPLRLAALPAEMTKDAPAVEHLKKIVNTTVGVKRESFGLGLLKETDSLKCVEAQAECAANERKVDEVERGRVAEIAAALTDAETTPALKRQREAAIETRAEEEKRNYMEAAEVAAKRARTYAAPIATQMSLSCRLSQHVQLVGRMDGVKYSDGTLTAVEHKRRIKRLFHEVKMYEKVQAVAYATLLRANACSLMVGEDGTVSYHPGAPLPTTAAGKGALRIVSNLVETHESDVAQHEVAEDVEQWDAWVGVAEKRASRLYEVFASTAAADQLEEALLEFDKGCSPEPAFLTLPSIGKAS